MVITLDGKSFLAGFHAGRGIRGHGIPDTDPVSVTVSGMDAPEEWHYDNRSFKFGLAAGFLLRLPGRGKGD